MSQLPLALALPPRYGPADFLVAPSNAAAHAAVERWPDWPHSVLLLVGPGGSGKTHLAHIWAARAGATALEPRDLAAGRAGHAPFRSALLDGLDGWHLPEADLFHFLNRAREQDTSLLITARSLPGRWPIATPDLLSRLRLAPAVVIEEPDETLMRAVLVKSFADRQLRVDAPLIDYLALRLDRSLAAVAAAVAALDTAGLARGLPVTRAMAAKVLPGLPEAPDDPS